MVDKFECPEPKCEMSQFGSASGCMVCSELYPMWKNSEAEAAMLAWESDLDDAPPPVITIEGRCNSEKMKKIREYLEEQVKYGSKHTMVPVSDEDDFTIIWNSNEF